MGSDDVTVEILKGIREELRLTRTELGARIDATNVRLDASNDRLERLERRQTEADVRVATALANLAGSVDQVRDLLR